jgi:ankyrin repeat protein
MGSQNSFNPLNEKCNESAILRSILQIAKVDNAQNMKKLLSLSDLTAEVLSHKMFSISVKSHDLEMVQTLLEAGLDPNTPLLVHGFPETALQFTSHIQFHDIAFDLARLLLSYGASTQPLYGGEPALAEAIISENEELITLLLDHGARACSGVLSTISRRNYYTHDAIYYFRMLRDAGADMRSPTPKGRTLLGLTSNNLLMEWLIEEGCDVNASQSYEFATGSDVLPHYVDHITTPLGIAVANGNLAGINVLLHAGAEVNMHINRIYFSIGSRNSLQEYQGHHNPS